jgi:hypothetical protein
MTDPIELPSRFVLLPAEVLKQVIKPDKPHEGVFLTFVQLLALAWNNEYKHTARLREDELYNTINADGSVKYGYLRISRREYFNRKRVIELNGWLRSTRPATGFVQFELDPAIIAALKKAGAPVSTGVHENAPLMRIEEEESINLILKDSESSSSSSPKKVHKNAQTALDPSEKKMRLLVENVRLLFDPEKHGVLEMRESFLAGIPERALGWIAKAYHDRMRLDSPIGMIVKHIKAQDAPDRYFMESYAQILPEEYLEAIGEIEFECAYCSERFSRREALRAHEAEKHPYPCSECDQWFLTQDEMKKHFEHHLNGRDVPVRFVTDESAQQPIREGSITPEQAWQSVLGQLQMEMPRASFDTWVRDTKVVRYDGNTLSVGTRNAYARDWLESRLASTVSRLLVGIMNASVCVNFVTVEVESR